MGDTMTLYDINEALVAAMARAEEYAEANGGELSEQLGAELDDLEMARGEKIGNICRYIKNLRSQADAIGREVEALCGRKDAKINRADSLETYLACMLGGERYEDANSVVTWRKSERVEVHAVAASLPPEYQRIIPEKREPDKAAIKAAIESGVKISGAWLEIHNNIQIK